MIPNFSDLKNGRVFDPQMLNRYSYVRNNPLKYNDPSGKDAVLIIGGPYGNHRYGHVALRVYGEGYDVTYDFGRYHGGRGRFGETGDGVLRVWNNFQKYIENESNTGRISTGYTFKTTEAQDAKIIGSYDKKIIDLTPETAGHDNYMKQYKLNEDYHWGGNNCTTTSKEALENGTGIELGEDTSGRGLKWYEKAAIQIEGWPNETFMPADFQNLLNQRTDVIRDEWRK